MTALNMAALAGILLWVTLLVVAHLKRPSGRYGLEFTISHYLTGVDGPEVDLGFYALAAGLVCLAFTVSWWPSIFYLVGAAGAVGACVTRAIWWDTPWHLRCAGLAFGGIGVADILTSIHHGWLLALALSAPAVAILTLQTRKSSAVQEKAVAALYVAFVCVFTVGRITGHVPV